LAEAALRQALTGQISLEQQRRIEQLLEQLDAVPSAGQLQKLRAVEVLEHIDTLEAQTAYWGRSPKGAPRGRLTQEAEASYSAWPSVLLTSPEMDAACFR